MENYASFDQVIDDLVSLNQTVEALRQRIVSSSQVAYDSQDARHVALEGLQCDIGACGNWIGVLTALKHLSKDRFGDNWDKEYRKLIGTGLSTEKAEDLMLDYLRNTLTTKLHFKIESLFANILRDLGALPKRRGFWHLSNALLERLGLPTTGREKEILTVLANLRNSFHSNGMHNNDDLISEIDGITFEFRRCRRVECASWKHIITVMRANVSLLESIILSNEVSSIRHPIQDDFASEANSSTYGR